MRIDMVMDLGWGSSGKGGVCGAFATHNEYEAVMCAYGRQAGHTYNHRKAGIELMTQQVPIGIVSETATSIFIGPGAIIHPETLKSEIDRYSKFLHNKKIYIHESAAVVTDHHAQAEAERGQTKMGSTSKGVGQAIIDRILRDPGSNAIARDAFRFDPELAPLVVSRYVYDQHVSKITGNILVEGAQGFGLSLYHGDYPFCTSRDVTPAQLTADIALPRRWHEHITVVGVARTRPIRVNNRDGYSGPAYPFQRELTWDKLGVKPERTTVTKLERRIFEFSIEQVLHAAHHCLKPDDDIALSFCDYIGEDEKESISNEIFEKTGVNVLYEVHGDDDSDVRWL
jgi:adenylosuccinate synthase